MRNVVFLLLFTSLFLMVGCTNKEDRAVEWFTTEEEAIEKGLQQEGTDTHAVLSIESYKGETLVFYDYGGALGVASITESDQGFSWYRSNAYSDIEGDVPYAYGGFKAKTENGIAIQILYGKAFDNSIKVMNLVRDTEKQVMKIDEDSRLFYAIHEAPFHQLEVMPEE
ncbi:hypothetical protein [Litchfieldia alkalitelluris]|uniref:hypothetical protein n=1 Tax=Litchfieldia alkalitelluris TaxID=304268 RepID=UPI0009969DE1|nr:hypothetical protein [Litchfieldia alkalitelluris]